MARVMRRFGVAIIGLVVAGVIGYGLINASNGSGTFGPIGAMANRVQLGPDRDVPCTPHDDGTETCATPIPALTAADRARGIPLEVDALEIPLDHVGPYRILVGEAVLPRGFIDEMTIELSNAFDKTYTADVFRLELEDLKTGRVLPTNIYEKGLSEADQRVSVYLVFRMESYDDGAVVEVKRIEVR